MLEPKILLFVILLYRVSHNYCIPLTPLDCLILKLPHDLTFLCIKILSLSYLELCVVSHIILSEAVGVDVEEEGLQLLQDPVLTTAPRLTRHCQQNLRLINFVLAALLQQGNKENQTGS